MRLYSDSSNRIIIQLTRSETAAALTGSKIGHRAVLIKAIIKCLENTDGLTRGRYRVRISLKGGSAVAFVSPMPSAALSFAAEGSENEITEALSALYDAGCASLCLSSLYLYRGGYRLMITPIVKSELPRHLCSELLLGISDGHHLTAVLEKGRLLCGQNAIEALGAPMSDR